MFKELMDEIPWETVLRERRTDQSCQFFEDISLRVQKLYIPMSVREGRKPTWLETEQGLIKFKCMGFSGLHLQIHVGILMFLKLWK